MIEELKLPEGTLSDFRKMKGWLEEKTKLESGLCFERQSVVWEHGESGAHTLLLFRLNPVAVIVKSLGDERCHMIPLGKTEPKKIIDTVCENGLIRENEDNNKELLLDAFEKPTVGDVYHLSPDFGCKGEKLYGCQAGVLAQIQLAAACIKALAESQQRVTVAIVNETVAGVEGVLGILDRVRPDTLVVSSSAATGKELLLGKGPAIGIKDGNWLADRTLWGAMMDLVTDTQTYIGNTGNTLERCYLAAKTKQVAAIYLPVVGMGTRVDEINKNDLEKTQNLVLKCVESFDTKNSNQ